jgi:hypothetical protein
VDNIVVAIGQFEYHSADGGDCWNRTLRQIPAKYSPVVRRAIEPVGLPRVADGFCWDYVTILPSGFGVVAGHKYTDLTHSTADAFATLDNGRNWQRLDPRRSTSLVTKIMHGLLAGGPTWPVERFESLVVPTPDSAALAWSDPGLFEDGAKSHVIATSDRGGNWSYYCLGDTNAYLGNDYEGRLLTLNDGFFVESLNGGKSWHRRGFTLEWPESYDKKRTALLRHLVFTSPGVGLALVVHWPRHWTRENQPDVGFVMTTDNGNRWHHLCVFSGPDIGDVNERHMLGLRVIDSNIQ